MRQTQKFKRAIGQDKIKQYFSGSVLDIGCGDSPVVKSCRRFDRKDGDAQYICSYIKDTFDTVYSSHCLQHMENAYKAIRQWYALVKEGGLLIVAVPDFFLYEGCIFPSRWSNEHYWAFSAQQHNNPYVICLQELDNVLGNVSQKTLMDNGYDYSVKNKDQTLGQAMAQWALVWRKK